MAKACAYLYRQCRFIDGFGEFGEFQPDKNPAFLFVHFVLGVVYKLHFLSFIIYSLCAESGG